MRRRLIQKRDRVGTERVIMLAEGTQMSSETSSPWIALIAAVGIGAIVAAMVGWWSAKAVTISNHRQNWINALRDDLVTYLKEIDTMHQRMAKVWGDTGEPGTTDDLEKQQETRNAALLVYRRILMRLNTTEDQHIQLAGKLKELLLVKSRTTDTQVTDAVVILARQVLKHEWAVAKYGIFTKPVVAIKTALRQMDDPSSP
jgi:hypothetical protein